MDRNAKVTDRKIGTMDRKAQTMDRIIKLMVTASNTMTIAFVPT